MGACRPLSLSLGLPGVSIRVLRAAFRLTFVHRRMGFKRFLLFAEASTLFFVDRRAGFKVFVNFLLTGVRVLMVFGRFLLAPTLKSAIRSAGFKVFG